ncbi:hypothetical protein J1N35_008048 [Gossypium stocksii]|uniref:Uncharacterized protein n=1 Tax=Gossypium stocksii TaxID=47602 RepID=A0A9D3WAB3_9ROSI|nr:hypothetical protein J1N35_008048 [Gossypium stocksii]
MTKTSYKQLESCKIAKVILDKLEDMFKGQVVLARSKKKHFKANSKKWKEYLATKGKCMELFIIEVFLV